MTQPPSADFTVPGYEALITRLLARGYGISDYVAARPDSADLIVRHDVDFDLDAAVTVARAEARHGWRACYFVLTRSEFYNPNAARSRAALATLTELGHEVGLHFDAALYPGDAAALAAAAQDESAQLAHWTGQPVRTFSFHRPHPTLLAQEFTVPGLVNAYAGRYFRDMGYCSDSRGTWRSGRPEDHPAIRDRRALQLLTHPIWWTADSANPSTKVASFLARRAKFLSDEAAAHCSAYTPGVPG